MNPAPSISAFARLLAFGALLALGARAQAQTDPLPSWNDGPTKQSIVNFIKATTTDGGSQFVHRCPNLRDNRALSHYPSLT